MSTVLMTGSAGFIGGYVVEELLDRGFSVIGLDDYSKYGKVTRSYDEHPAYTFVEGDARDTELLVSLIEDCEHFIAGAALIGGISYFHAYPYDLLATNERIISSSCDAASNVPRASTRRSESWGLTQRRPSTRCSTSSSPGSRRRSGEGHI